MYNNFLPKNISLLLNVIKKQNFKKGPIIEKLPKISTSFLKIPYEEQYECRDFKKK